MDIIKNMNERVKMLSITDIKLAQAAAMCVILIIVKLVPQIMNINIWWLIAFSVLLGIKPAYAFFFKD